MKNTTGNRQARPSPSADGEAATGGGIKALVGNKSDPVMALKAGSTILVLLLSFLTCGLYLIYWNIKAAEVLNVVSERQVISPAVAVISGADKPACIAESVVRQYFKSA